jgi:hypothetical protein
MGYQPRSKLVKDENGDLLTDFNSILNRWKNYHIYLNIRQKFFLIHHLKNGEWGVVL